MGLRLSRMRCLMIGKLKIQYIQAIERTAGGALDEHFSCSVTMAENIIDTYLKNRLKCQKDT
ncbi:MAG: hypothetical protein IIU83_06700 [Fibrobacteraceae bacterium]|nr:hypothetical protein [Fibrobacteraceae bacterium]